MPSYREFNPAVFYIVTFPFFFGVMYGDVGHGSILLFAGLFMVIFHDKLIEAGVSQKVTDFRYCLLLMGFFATYMGLIYNDFMSIPLNVFGSCYELDAALEELKRDHGRPVTPKLKSPGCIYQFGMDPVWMLSTDELSFYNSFKMKTSVILGVVHMLMGVVLKGVNAIHFGRDLDFKHQFIPQILLLTCMFGYMDLLIVQKWLIDWSTVHTGAAPSIVTSMVSLFLNFGELPENSGEAPVLTHQVWWNKAMLAVIVICPPWMLFVKPLILKRQHEELCKAKERQGGDVELSSVDNMGERM